MLTAAFNALTENANHNLHDRFVHAQNPHQVWVLIKNFVVHDFAEISKWVWVKYMYTIKIFIIISYISCTVF